MKRTALSPKPKPHKCRVCHGAFSKARSIQPTCEKFECKVAYAERVAAKAKAKRVIEAKREIAKRKEALKTIPQLKAELQAVVNRYVRLRDELAGWPCICCGRFPKASYLTGGEWDAGHYRSVGSADHLRFDERNIHRQLKQCNRDGAGRAVDYRIGLINRYGLAYVEELEADNAVIKWTREYLLERKAYFRQKLKELQAKPLREAA